MSLDEFIEQLQLEPDYRDQIAHIERIPPRKAKRAPNLPEYPPVITQRLKWMGIEQLYSHQLEALNFINSGHHVVISTSTASGKSLCYQIPSLCAALSPKRERSLYLFPTKALAQDQLRKLAAWNLHPQVLAATYDGDTPKSERAFIKRTAHIVLSNPDMLHCGILPYHTSWSAFFEKLRYIILDELHTYRGVFGAHIAQIMRRLRRIAALYGANPQFIACSATLINPAELMEKLTGYKAETVCTNGSPSGSRTFVLWNPPLIGRDKSERRSVHIEAADLFARSVATGIRNIVFTRARKSAELILRYAKQELGRSRPALRSKVAAYRAGYTPSERRKIERDLFDGRLIGVTATNALELGVDIGGLDATIQAGYPGTITSTWQQAGRAGRSEGEALNILIATDNPLDQYLIRHPEALFGKPIELVVINIDNRRILGAHLICAAHESPIQENDLALFGDQASLLLCDLEEAGFLSHRGDRWYYQGGRFPAGDFSIRSAGADHYSIIDASHAGELIGEVDSSRAFETVHTGAVYLHQSETYLIEKLDIDRREALANRADLNYYTEPLVISQITVLSERKRIKLLNTNVAFGEVVVQSQVIGYKEMDIRTESVIARKELDLPPSLFETEALWLALSPEVTSDLISGGYDLAGAIHAAEHAAIGIMPIISVCDRWDVGGVSTPLHPDIGGAAIFIYDAYPGGAGITDAAFERAFELLSAAAECIQLCPCEEGCPSCVQSPKCGNNNRPLDKLGANRLLSLVLNGWKLQ
ncbi:MAG: DEAD/DEAH box helicase [Armatimonadetes bacterium]|nr:DEAD/DEAH box helicase [Armatimonadota bacterium]